MDLKSGTPVRDATTLTLDTPADSRTSTTIKRRSKFTQSFINGFAAIFVIPADLFIFLGLRYGWEWFISWVVQLDSPTIRTNFRILSFYPDWVVRLLYTHGAMFSSNTTEGNVDRELFKFLLTGTGPVAGEVERFNAQQEYLYGSKAKLVEDCPLVYFKLADNPLLHDAELLRMVFGEQLGFNGEQLGGNFEPRMIVLSPAESVNLSPELQMGLAECVDLDSRRLWYVIQLLTDPTAISKLLIRGTPYLYSSISKTIENEWALRSGIINHPHVTEEHVVYMLENDWVSGWSYASDHDKWLVELTPRLVDCLLKLDYNAITNVLLMKNNISLKVMLAVYCNPRIRVEDKEAFSDKMMRFTFKVSWLEFVKYALQLSHYQLSEIEQLPLSWLEDLMVSEYGYATGKGKVCVS